MVPQCALKHWTYLTCGEPVRPRLLPGAPGNADVVVKPPKGNYYTIRVTMLNIPEIIITVYAHIALICRGLSCLYSSSVVNFIIWQSNIPIYCHNQSGSKIATRLLKGWCQCYFYQKCRHLLSVTVGHLNNYQAFLQVKFSSCWWGYDVKLI